MEQTDWKRPGPLSLFLLTCARMLVAGVLLSTVLVSIIPALVAPVPFTGDGVLNAAMQAVLSSGLAPTAKASDPGVPAKRPKTVPTTKSGKSPRVVDKNVGVDHSPQPDPMLAVRSYILKIYAAKLCALIAGLLFLLAAVVLLLRTY
jgi:hypothetical protein